MQPNMKKEYRAELKSLGLAARQLNKADVKDARATDKAVIKLQRELGRRRRARIRELAGIERREAILKGRLS